MIKFTVDINLPDIDEISESLDKVLTNPTIKNGILDANNRIIDKIVINTSNGKQVNGQSMRGYSDKGKNSYKDKRKRFKHQVKPPNITIDNKRGILKQLTMKEVATKPFVKHFMLGFKREDRSHEKTNKFYSNKKQSNTNTQIAKYHYNLGKSWFGINEKDATEWGKRIVSLFNDVWSKK